MRRIRLLAGVTAAVVAAATLSAPAHAADPVAADTGRDGTQAAMLAYQTVYPTISDSAAQLAAAQQDTRKQLHDKLAAEPQTYGGGYFDPPSGVTHLALTTQASADRAVAAGRALGLTVAAKVVARSYDELERLAATVRTGTDQLAVVAKGRVGIEVSSNTVTVALTSQEAASLPSSAIPSWVTIVPASADLVELDVCTSRANCNDSLRSGLAIRHSGGACSTGFTARSGSVRYILTAGHCGASTTSTWYTAGTSIGPMTTANAINSGAVDAGRIQVTNSTYAADTVGRIAISASSWVPVRGRAHHMSFIWAGDVVCISARYQAPATNGNPCGVIASVSDAAQGGLTRYEGYDPCPGDSGGGVYWLPSSGQRHAFGLHSRSITGCNNTASNKKKAWFSAVPNFWNTMNYDLG
ncbi:hypothetical protein AB0M91_15610 [Micromonospora rifamycinica]|uniref:hypothetical protein n=1 Tax=Micromonospora rifamycinica TaxID=291594 RepID=UPI0033FAA449